MRVICMCLKASAVEPRMPGRLLREQQHSSLSPMFILEYLLGPSRRRRSGSARRFLIDGDVSLLLEEDSPGEHLAFATCPGRMPEDDWVRSLQAPWRVDGEPLECGARSMVCVEPGTGRTLLVSLWPRAALTHQVFRSALSAQLRAHRAWQALLHPMVQGQTC
jgi:hypothetical protein